METDTGTMSAEDHTSAALHSALDACLAGEGDGSEKAKKMAKIIKAMHEGKEVSVAEEGGERPAGEKKEPDDEKKDVDKTEKAEKSPPDDRTEQFRGFTDRLEQTGPLPDPNIDRARGILKHVHIAGMVSRTDGARYSIDAHKKAGPRFEQMPVGLDHDYTSSPLKVAQAWGVLSNITVESDGPYGDLAYLKSHERTEQVLEDAERKTGIFSLSMVAKTRGNGLDIQEYVPSRVDLVVRGATTRTLFNQEQQPADGVSKEEFSALKARFEQLAAKNAELESRLTLKEAYVAPAIRLEQEIKKVEKESSKTIDLKKHWDTSLPSVKS